MKNCQLAFVMAGVVGIAGSARAAVDVTVNGVEYAITTVTPALTTGSGGNQYFSYPGTLTQDLFSTLASQRRKPMQSGPT